MAQSWLWDRKITEKEVLKILADPGHDAFIHYAALLLARMNRPKEVFSRYLNKQDFCRNWPTIKKQMRKDTRNQRRILFWQEIYRYLSEKLRAEGVEIRKPRGGVNTASLAYYVGTAVRLQRMKLGMSQGDLAQKSGLAQQAISNIERGLANPSLATLEKVGRGLGFDPGKISAMTFAAEGSLTEAATTYVD